MKNILRKSIMILMAVLMAVLSSSVAFGADNADVYTISYELNKGENNPANPDTYTKGQTLTFADPVREYHTFMGWYLDKSLKTPVTGISETAEGDLVLYAKWNLEALNINGEGAEDMIWSWWYYPQVVSSGSNIYYGYSTSEGFCGVAKYNGDTGKTERTDLKCILPVDDHNGLAVTEMDDGRIMCAYAGGHNNNNEIHIRISENPGDISNFSKHIILESAGKTCYSQMLRYKGDYYVFYRVNNHSWAYRSSPDGESWGEETILIKTTMQYYCRFMPTTEEGLFRICMYSNPREEDPNIRMGFFDAESKTLLNSDAKTTAGTSRLSQEGFDIIIECPEGSRQRLFDVAITEPERPLILYTTFTSANKANDSVYYLYDKGKTYKICDGGKPIMSNNYQCGAAFAGVYQFVSIRNADGKDIVELYDYSENEITLQKTVYSKETGDNHHRNGRPIVDVNGKAFVWHEGYYNPAKYTDFFTNARFSTEFFDGKTEESILHFNCDKATRGFKITKREGGCTTDGTEVYTCQCSASYTKVISPRGHIYEERVIFPTCTEDGYTECRCYCGYSYTKDTVNASGHKEELIPAVSPTCTEGGLTEGRKCTVCGVVTEMQREIPASGHKEAVIPAVAATYTSDGLTEGKICEVCGEVIKKQKTVARKKLKKVTEVKVKKTTTSSVKLSWKKVTGAQSYKVYYTADGKKWKSVRTTETSLTVNKLTAGKSYKFKVKAFAGKYYGAVSNAVKTATRVNKVSLSSVSSSKKQQLTVSWKTVSGASGYVVEYSTTKKFTKKTTDTAILKKGSAKKTTLKGLESDKTYYVRVRAYKTVNGKKPYGSYSSIRSVKIK